MNNLVSLMPKEEKKDKKDDKKIEKKDDDKKVEVPAPGVPNVQVNIKVSPNKKDYVKVKEDVSESDK